MGPPDLSNCFIALPTVPGYVSPELFKNFPPNAPALFSTNFRTRPVRFVPIPAPQYAVRTYDPRDVYERSNFYRDKYPEFVHTIQSLPIAWEDLYAYFDPLDIWMEGAGFCFHVIHRLAAVNIEKRRQLEYFVAYWAENNIAKLARLPLHDPVALVFESEDRQYFDLDGLTSYEITTLYSMLNQQCYALQPKIHHFKLEQARLAEIERQNSTPPAPVMYRPYVQTQILLHGSPGVVNRDNPSPVGAPQGSSREFTGKYQGRRDVSYEDNHNRYPSQVITQAPEPIYAYTPHQHPQHGYRVPSRQVHAPETPPRHFQHRVLSSESNQDRIVSSTVIGVNRPRSYSNKNKMQNNYNTARYEAASQIRETTAMSDTRQPYKTSYKSWDYSTGAVDEAGRTLYLRGFTFLEFHSDLVPEMMDCCGEIVAYKPSSIKEFAFITFKSHENALEAIKLFNGKALDNGVKLKVAHQFPKGTFESSNDYHRYRGNSFGGNQRYSEDSIRGPFDNNERRRTHGKGMATDRDASTLNVSIQKSREASNLPPKPVDTPPKINTETKKQQPRDITPKGKNTHQHANSGQSTKTVKNLGKAKSRADGIVPVPTPTKKGSFAVSEDLSVPDDGHYLGSSFSSYDSSSNLRKGSIFDEAPTNTSTKDITNALHNRSKNDESSANNAPISACPEPQDNKTFAQAADRPRKPASLRQKKNKTRSNDSNRAATDSVTDGKSTQKGVIGTTGDATVVTMVSKTDGTRLDSSNTGVPIVAANMNDFSSKPPKPHLKHKNKASSHYNPSNMHQPRDEGSAMSTPTKNSTKTAHVSPRNAVTETGSPMSSKPKHGKTHSNLSSFSIELRMKVGDGSEKIMNKVTDKAGESPRSEAQNPTRSKSFKRNKSNADLKENIYLGKTPTAFEVNILADPSHWPSLGEGKPKAQGESKQVGQSPLAPLDTTLGRRLPMVRRESMAMIVSQKAKIVPVIPLPRPSSIIKSRSVSEDSSKSDDTIIAVVNTTGTRLWPTVVKWAGKPPSTEDVNDHPKALPEATNSTAANSDW